MLFLLTLLLVGCAKAPLELSQQAWSIMQASQRQGGEGAPDVWATANAQYDSAWQIINQQNQEWFFLRDFSRADSVLIRASTSANLAIKVARENRERYRGELARQIDHLQERLATHRGVTDNHLGRLQLRKALTSAELMVAAASNSRNLDSLEIIQTAVDQARVAVTTLETRLAQDDLVDGNETRAWRRWVQETTEWSRSGAGDALVVIKADHRAYLLQKGKIVDIFPVELGYRSAREKLYAGDAATPEGVYTVIKRRPSGSKYYKALLLDYPNAEDRRRFEKARRNGELSRNFRIGGDIEIHGQGGKGFDWTRGCVALANNDMDRVIALMDVGDRVAIVRRCDGWPR